MILAHARRPLIGLAALLLLGSAQAQWDPSAGQWGKELSSDLRVMTWNVEDGICSSNDKSGVGLTNWDAIARIIASMRPDVLILQECGDNSGNGTGGSGDSQSALLTTCEMLMHGGIDTFNGGAVIGSYVQLHAPGYDLPHIFVGGGTDGFNRNVIMSRYPFADLNGDGNAEFSDFFMLADLYATGSNGGIRGYQHAEIDLDDGVYAGDLVIGNNHLKAGGSASDKADRLKAAQNIAYYIDAQFNGLGGPVADPNGKVLNPAATQILGPDTLVITGGDWNEDELTNGAKGPAEWITRAQFTGGTDGTDKDRSDMVYDAATEFFSGDRETLGSSKLDYLAWQDSVATQRRAFIFDSNKAQAGGGVGALPPELAGYLLPNLASSFAADHRPVVVDLQLPLSGGPCNTAATDLGLGLAGTGGLVPFFTVCGELSTGNTADFLLEDALPLANAWLVISFFQGNLPFAQGTLVPLPDILLGPVPTDASGQLLLPGVAGGGGPADLYMQWVVIDPGAPVGKAMSNGERVHYLP